MDDPATIAALAKHEWHGVSTSNLTLAILNYREALDEARDGAPKGILPEHLEGYRLYLNLALADAVKQLKWRRTLNEDYAATPDREIIQLIKDRLPVADVLEWYCKVHYKQRDQFTFECPLHGDGKDRDASGVIYAKEQRWWCFGCNAGGDVFDAVQRFERIELRDAIKKLARHLGIELKPLVNPNRPKAIYEAPEYQSEA